MISRVKDASLSDRLKELRETKGLTQQEFADVLELSIVSIGAYENGTATPNTEPLIKISNIFNVSLDWLCCTESNIKKEHRTIKNYKDVFLMLCDIMNEFRQLLTNSCDENGQTIETYAVQYNLSKEVVDGIAETASVNIQIYDENLCSIFSDYNDMNKLLNKGAITKKLYSSWFEGFCNKLADIPTPQNELDEFQDEHIKRTVFENNLEDMKTKIKIRIRDIEKKTELSTSEKEELNSLKTILAEQIQLEKIMNEIDNGDETNGNSTKKG